MTRIPFIFFIVIFPILLESNSNFNNSLGKQDSNSIYFVFAPIHRGSGDIYKIGYYLSSNLSINIDFINQVRNLSLEDVDSRSYATSGFRGSSGLCINVLCYVTKKQVNQTAGISLDFFPIKKGNWLDGFLLSPFLLLDPGLTVKIQELRVINQDPNFIEGLKKSYLDIDFNKPLLDYSYHYKDRWIYGLSLGYRWHPRNQTFFWGFEFPIFWNIPQREVQLNYFAPNLNTSIQDLKMEDYLIKYYLRRIFIPSLFSDYSWKNSDFISKLYIGVSF